MTTLVLANEATAARRRAYFYLVDATDGMTPETGEASGQPQISTNGGAWTNTGIGTLSAIGNGEYYADLTQAAVATAGDRIRTRYKSANTAEGRGTTFHAVAFDPHDVADLGLANLDAAVSTRASAAALATTDATATAIAADTTTLLSRLSAARAGYLDVLAGWTGTLRQALRAMTSKAAGEASSDLTGGSSTFVNTTDSQEGIRDALGAGSSPEDIRSAVWANDDGYRTLTSTAAQVADALDGPDITVHRGDSLSVALTGLVIPADWTRLLFTAKRGLSDADTASVVQIVLTNPGAVPDGLKYLEGAAPVSPVVAADAALTVVSLTALTITMKPRATKDLGIGSGWFYDVQADYGGAGDTTTVCVGAFAVDADVTRSTPA